MARTLIISNTAYNDIQNAVFYYNQQQHGLGRRFEHSTHNAFVKIRRFPFSASFAYDDVRYKVIDQFPYIVLYESDEDNVYILRVYHTNQSPDKMKL